MSGAPVGPSVAADGSLSGRRPGRALPRRFLQGVVAAAVTLAIVGLSRVPYTAEPSEDAELRLAWRYRSERVQQCRRLSEEEQEKLPAHMRRTEDCTRGLRPYRLTVAVDGAEAGVGFVDTVRARGAESDRPLFVFRRISLAPRSHAVRVLFAPVGEGGHAPLGVDTTITFARRQVVLVTYDEDARRLVVRTALP